MVMWDLLLRSLRLGGRSFTKVVHPSARNLFRACYLATGPAGTSYFPHLRHVQTQVYVSDCIPAYIDTTPKRK
jgi:hypothetical protein